MPDLENPNLLVSQTSERTSRKVEYASGGAAGGGGLGAGIGVVLALWTFNRWLPPDMQAIEGAQVAWIGAWGVALSGACAWVGAMQLGYRVKERLENMLPLPKDIAPPLKPPYDVYEPTFHHDRS